MSTVGRNGKFRKDVAENVAEVFRVATGDSRFGEAFPPGEVTLLTEFEAEGYTVAVVLLPDSTKTKLTPREMTVASLVGMGLRNGGIADELGIGKGTVRTHLCNIYRKWRVRSRAELARLWVAHPVLNPGGNSC